MRSCYCGAKFVSVDDFCVTLVGYLSLPDHDHDDNCASVTYRCENNHTETVNIRRVCPNPSCDWKGRETCFCHQGIKAEGYPRPPSWDEPGDIPYTVTCEGSCRKLLPEEGHSCPPRSEIAVWETSWEGPITVTLPPGPPEGTKFIPLQVSTQPLKIRAGTSDATGPWITLIADEDDEQ